MNSLKIETAGNKLMYLPGDRINGEVSWSLFQGATEVELRLFWYTAGKGTVDTNTVDVITFSSPLKDERRDFSFTLPKIPYSFSGKLISLIWALELIAKPFNASFKLDISMGPERREIILERKTILSETAGQSF